MRISVRDTRSDEVTHGSSWPHADTHDCRGADYVTVFNPRLLFILKLIGGKSAKESSSDTLLLPVSVCESWVDDCLA